MSLSQNTNSVPPFLGGTVRDAIEALGITQFPSAGNWYQIIGGLIVQGGYVSVLDGVVQAVSFNAPYEKEVLGVWLQVVAGAGNGAFVGGPVALDSFDIYNGVGDRDYYWLSLGV